MAQPSSSQDLLSLLLGGGTGSASKVLPDSEFLHQQLPAPISPSIDTENNASNQAPVLPGQATLETLFSSLKNNPPNNARLYNVVSDAGHADLQPHAATPSTSIAQPRAAASSDIHQSPPIDPAEGRNLLLSMLNLREPYHKEASAPRSSSVSDARAVVEEIGSRQETMSKIDCQSTEEQPREAAGESNPDNHTQSSIPADNDLTVPKVMGREEQGLATEEPNGTNAGEGSTKQFSEVRQEEQPVSPSSPERRPRPIQPTTPELSSPHPRREDTKDSPSLQDNDAGHVGFHDSANSPAARSSHSNLEESSHTRLGPETPLEEFLLDIQSTEQIPDAEVIDRVPISRFTSPHQYTRGKQIAVNGLIAYGTRAGRVRVIDPDTGARRIKKLHPGLVEDMHISVDQPTGNQGKAIRRLATCFRNSICIWRLPSTFSDDESAEEAAFEIVLEGGMKVDSIRFSPVDAQCLLFTVANAPSVFLLDLRAGYYHQGPRIGLQPKDIDALRVVDLPAPLACTAWASNGRRLAAISTQGHVFIHDLYSKKTSSAQLPLDGNELGSPEHIELIGGHNTDDDTALLIFYERQSVLDIHCLDNLNQPVSRLKLFSRHGQVNGRTDSGIIRVCKVQGYNAIVVSVSSTGTAYCIPLQLQSNAPSQGHLLAEPGSAADARLRSPQIQFPRFGTPGAVKTPHSILQLVVSQLNGCPSLFYLHSEGFEQTSLSASAFEGQKNPTDVESLDNDITAAASAVSSGLPQNIRASEEKEAFAPLSSRFEMDQKASFSAPPHLPESTSHKHSESQMCGSITPIGDDARMLGAMQQHLAEQNLVFAQMLATQQKMQEAQFLQLSREIAAIRSEQADPFERASQAIRSEIRESLLPVIANALAEISHSTSTSIASHASGEIEQRLEDILQRSQNSISQSLESASLEIGAAVTKSLSGTLERYLARLTISQAEQGDAIEQIKEVLLAEQMKREESTTRMETQMQSIRSHLDRAVNVQPVWTPGRSPQAASIGNTMNVSSDQNIQSLKNGETQEHIARPTTPSEAYEDMFLHTLQRDPDPLVRLVDMAPPGRMDRVLPYDGAPLVTAPAFMALCLRLAQEFDNGLTTLDERNGRVRLAWILSCLRASKWSKANPLHAPYLPRVFTQVMHSLNLRKQRLHSQEDRELVERVLRAADELSGLR